MIIGLGVVAVAAVGGRAAAVWARSKKKQSAAEYDIPECVVNYNASLAAYLEAIGSGNLEAELINRLTLDLDALKENADSGTISLELSVEESDQFVHLIADYTNKLAEANSVELTGFEKADADSAGDVIVDMRRYLEAKGTSLTSRPEAGFSFDDEPAGAQLLHGILEVGLNRPRAGAGLLRDRRPSELDGLFDAAQLDHKSARGFAGSRRREPDS